MNWDSHTSDEELVRAIDGELPQPHDREVQEHLVRCWRCRARKADLEQAIAGFVHLQRDMLDPQIPGPEGPAALLRARLSVIEGEAGEISGLLSPWNRYALPAAIPALALVLLCIGVYWFSAPSVSAASLPNAQLTPGATRQVSREQICTVPAEDDRWTVPAELARHVFSGYGVRKPRPGAYEIDYLITPALGGAEDARNLWPQPYGDGLWNAHVKDALEDRLRNLVCSGDLDLSAAQREISSNWIAAYRKYFHTARPLPVHASFVKDRPWQ